MFSLDHNNNAKAPNKFLAKKTALCLAFHCNLHKMLSADENDQQTNKQTTGINIPVEI